MFLIHNLLPSKFAFLTVFREVKTRGTTGSQSRNNNVNWILSLPPAVSLYCNPELEMFAQILEMTDFTAENKV